MTKYYLDACIWLNLLNKEQTKIQGLPVWKITELFLKQYEGNIIISDIVLREVLNKAQNKEAIKILDTYSGIIQITPKEQNLGREIETKEEYTLSFFDCMHTALAKTRGYILITRDKELLERGKTYVTILKPEDLIY